MKELTVNGLVLGETKLTDTKKFIKILTDKMGKISVIVHGATGFKSKHLAAVKPYSYSSFTITQKRDSYTLKEAELKKSFFNISTDVMSLALGSYIMSIADYVSNEADDSLELLSLTMNSLYAIIEKIKPHGLIKSVFELKCAAIIGFAPSVVACCNCKRDITTVNSFIKLYDGNAVCEQCRNKAKLSDFEVTYHLTPAVINAIRYVIISDTKKVFSFSIPDDEIKLFSDITEKYLDAHIEKGFPALKIYKTLIQ